MATLGTYIVDVNLKAHTVSARMVGSPTAPSGVSADVFGGAGTITHFFGLAGGAPTGSNGFTLTDHIENQFAYAIGTNQPHVSGGAFPADTQGVFVYVSIPIYGITGCTPGPTCLVTIDSADGSAKFNGSSTAVPYMFFKTVLEKSDFTPQQGKDFTDQTVGGVGGIDYFRSLVFRASPNVSDFRFGVSASAAFAAPNGTRYRVDFPGDSLPNRVGTSLNDLRSDPDWRVIGNAAAGAAAGDSTTVSLSCPAGGSPCFQIATIAPSLANNSDSLLYFRSDSIGSTDNAYMSAKLATSGLINNTPNVFLTMQDKTKLISFGISGNTAGFTTNSSTAFVTNGSFAVTPSTVTTWQISKFGADSVVAYTDGTRKVKVAYTALSAAAASSARYPFFAFGNRTFFNLLANPSATTSRWASLTYEIGVTGP